MGTYQLAGAAAAHLDDAVQAAVHLGFAGSAVVEVVGSRRPDRFSFSLRSGRCQWEKEEFSTPICEQGERCMDVIAVQLRAQCIALHPYMS